jgi:hypothetical protein
MNSLKVCEAGSRAAVIELCVGVLADIALFSGFKKL